MSKIYKIIRRRLYYLFRRKYFLESVKRRKGECRHCSCCEVKVFSSKHRCKYYDSENKTCLVFGTSKMPILCNYYPFDEKDRWDEYKMRCGFYWD